MTLKKDAENSAKDTGKGRVCIITLYDNVNYGNKLQNYAVKWLVEQRGYKADTLVLRKDPFRETVKLVIRKLKAGRGDVKAERYVNLSAFSREYLGIKYYITSTGQIGEDISLRYDMFVTGSDQVWNPEVRTTDLENFLLTFTSDDKKVSIAPSLGTDTVPDNMKTRFSDGLMGFRKLSCREESGCKVIEELTGRNVVRLCDPTMALPAEFWRDFAGRGRDKSNHRPQLRSFIKRGKMYGGRGREIDICGQPYVMMFFLGECDETLRSMIYEYAEERGYAVKIPSSKLDPDYAMMPQEFVAMIDGAQMVFTDSFHAAAFSINLGTPFWVFDRNIDRADDLNTHMGSRIESLTEEFGLEDRYIRDVESLAVEGTEAFDAPVVFDLAELKLEEERERMSKYLAEALERPSGLQAIKDMFED